MELWLWNYKYRTMVATEGTSAILLFMRIIVFFDIQLEMRNDDYAVSSLNRLQSSSSSSFKYYMRLAHEKEEVESRREASGQKYSFLKKSLLFVLSLMSASSSTE